jgi:hypothetical protein
MNAPPSGSEIVVHAMLGRSIIPEGQIPGTPGVPVREFLLDGMLAEFIQ